MRSGMIGFLTGILLLVQMQSLPQTSTVLLLASLVLCIFSRLLPVRLVACVVLGFLWAYFRADLILQHELPAELEGQTLQVTGHVVSMPEKRRNRVRFEFVIDKLRYSGDRYFATPGKVRLNWYRTTEKLTPGQEWQLKVRLKRPHGFMNPGGFDYERWLFLKRIRATGYVVDAATNHSTGGYHGQWINRLRYHLRQSLITTVSECRQCDLLLALGLGDRSLIGADKRETLVRTGTSHLLAISGLHIGLVATLVFFAVRWLWGRGGYLPRYYSSLHAGVFAAIGIGCLYALLAGFTIPTQRALLMVSVVLLSLVSPGRYAFSLILSVAMLAVLCLDPFAVLDAGFWLSFTAVGIIAYGMTCRNGETSIFWRWGRVQVLVAIGIAPLLLTWFQQVSIVSVAANLFAVPWVSLLVVPLTLAGTFFLPVSTTFSGICLVLADRALSLLWPLLEILGGSPLAVWQQASPAPWAMLAAVAGVLILLQPRGMPGRWLGVCWLLPLLMPIQPRPAPGAMWITLLDVGQGLAAVIHTHRHGMVYDTGARFSDTFNAGEAVVVPYLRQTGVRQPDLLLISHSDNDHAGGASAVLRAYPETTVLGSSPNGLPRRQSQPCTAGQTWQWDAVRFTVLHPADGSHYHKNNNRSCVLRISGSYGTLLLTGDIEKEIEALLLREYADTLPAEVLVVPHHGSKTSSTPGFVQAVQPDWALFAAGYRNRFKLPNQDIITRYQQNHSKVLNTARRGAILVRFTQSGLTVEWYRQKARRFWHSYQAKFSVKREFD